MVLIDLTEDSHPILSPTPLGQREEGGREISPGETLVQPSTPLGFKCFIHNRKKLVYKIVIL